MSASLPNQTSTSGDANKKGGTPEGVRQEKINMLNVAEAKPVGKANIITAGFHTQSAHKKLAIWLDSLVEKAKDKPVVQMVSLTPELAEVLLGRNPANRKISESIVENYAHEIEGGRWAFNGEPIIVSDTGELNDGQHRCRAVIAANTAIDTILIVGIKRDTRTTLDQGRTRTAGDYLSMEGNVYATVLGAAANIAWQVRERGVVKRGGSAMATKSEVLQFVREHPGLVRSVAYVHEKGADAAGGKTVLAASHFLLCATGRPEDADHFIISLICGAGLRVGDPILYVRNRLINERRILRNGDRVELIFKAWNAWRKRETVTRMILTGSVLPVLER